MAVDYTTHDGVAVITLNNPPVNGLGLSTRPGIVEGIERAQNDPAIKAIVLTGAGKAFSGGADITEFNTPKATQEPTLAHGHQGRRRQREAGRRGDSQRRDGRRPGTRARRALPHRRARRADRAAGSEARHPAGRGRHAALAARGRPRSRAEHDRLRRAGDVGEAGRLGSVRRSRAKAIWPKPRSRSPARSARKRARIRRCATARSSIRTPPVSSSSRATPSRRWRRISRRR